MLNLSGMLGSIVTALILTFASNLNLLRTTRICISISLVAFCGLILTLYFTDFVTEWPCYFANCVIGFSIIPLFFLSYELASEQTTKLGVGEATSCGIINMIANGLSFIEVLILTPVLKHDTPKSSLASFLTIAVVQVVAFILILIAKNK